MSQVTIRHYTPDNYDKVADLYRETEITFVDLVGLGIQDALAAEHLVLRIGR